MLETLFLFCFSVVLVFMVIYYKTLDRVLNLDKKINELNKITMFKDGHTKQSLIRDFKFYIAIISGSYIRKVESGLLLSELGKLRRCLLVQIPFYLTLFLIPVLSKFT